MRALIKIVLFIPFVMLAYLLLFADMIIGIVKCLVYCRIQPVLFEWICDKFHNEKQ